jgi:hypothetical protein
MRKAYAICAGAVEVLVLAAGAVAMIVAAAVVL